MVRRRTGRTGRPGLLGTVARTAVIAGTAMMTASSVNRTEQHRDAEQPAASPPPANPDIDLVSQCARLAQLRDSGVLTQEEFRSAKAELLPG